ncbi:hypothetical protein IFO70_35100 [Phormidium tenue FACHB-886]|nr:hypothetical protein [Phormidium tenue FACHB-886]
MGKVSTDNPNNIWYIAVPANGEFTQPHFHFGERVSWVLEEQGDRYQVTGRIMGMWFHNNNWNYDINLDVEQVEGNCQN